MSATRKILLVDDDMDFSHLLAGSLNLHDEFKCDAASTAAAAFEKARGEKFDIILLDIALPDMDGREVCRTMRRDRITAPIIMLTGSDSEADTILGLEAGANDYVVKPFRFGVLLARMRAHLRSHDRNEDATFAVGPYTFHPGTKFLVSDDGAKVRLTEREAAIIRYLRRSGPNAASRDMLLSEVWGYNSGVTTHTVETHIYRLRQKIEKNPSQAEILVTECGGYKLVS